MFAMRRSLCVLGGLGFLAARAAIADLVAGGGTETVAKKKCPVTLTGAQVLSVEDPTHRGQFVQSVCLAKRSLDTTVFAVSPGGSGFVLTTRVDAESGQLVNRIARAGSEWFVEETMDLGFSAPTPWELMHRAGRESMRAGGLFAKSRIRYGGGEATFRAASKKDAQDQYASFFWDGPDGAAVVRSLSSQLSPQQACDIGWMSVLLDAGVEVEQNGVLHNWHGSSKTILAYGLRKVAAAGCQEKLPRLRVEMVPSAEFRGGKPVEGFASFCAAHFDSAGCGVLVAGGQQ